MSEKTNLKISDESKNNDLINLEFINENKLYSPICNKKYKKNDQLISIKYEIPIEYINISTEINNIDDLIKLTYDYQKDIKVKKYLI